MGADPGIGKAGAPIGTIEWAQYVRLTSQLVIDEARKAPREAKELVEFIRQHEAWTLMNKPDGSFFKRFEDFCEHPKPWGWGTKWDELRPILEGVAGKQAVALMAVSPAQGPKAGPGRGNGKRSDKMSECFTHSDGKAREAERLRAVKRAPEAVHDLFRAGVIGLSEAAKLGPKGLDPNVAAKVTEVAAAAVAIVKAAPEPKTKPERAALKRKVNAVVRERMNIKTKTGIDKVLAALRALERDDLIRLRDEIDRLLSEAA